MPWGSAVSLKVSARCREAIRSHVDGWISCELHAALLLYSYKKSKVRACDLIPTYHTERAALSCCRPPMSEGHPISMVCSRSGVRLYAATLRSGPGLLCAVAHFVSAMYGTVWVLSRICRPQEEPLSAGRVRVHTCCECYNKKGYIRTWYVYTIFFFIFRSMRYTCLLYTSPSPRDRG